MHFLLLIPALLAAVLPAVDAAAMTALERRGRTLAQSMCAQCHAVGRSGKSPHVGAPPFRQIDRRLDLDTLTDRLRDGLVSGHPDMPAFRFTRDDARALVDYLRHIAGP